MTGGTARGTAGGTHAAAPTGTGGSAPRHVSGGVLREVVLVLSLFVVGGLVGAGVWRLVWSPFRGTVLAGVWYPQTNASPFASTGLFVLIGAVLGLVLGLLSALLTERRELLVLGLVLVAAVLAAWVMYEVGRIGLPEDPSVLARTAPDRSQLPATLTVRGISSFAAFPIGAVLGVSAVFIGLSRKPPEEHHPDTPAG